MFRWNHIAAVIVSTAMVFSMMPLGVLAADQTGTEMTVQAEQPEAGVADAGEYSGAGERTIGIAVNDTEAKTDAGLEETGSDTDAVNSVTGAGAEEPAAGDAAGAGLDESASSDVTGADPAEESGQGTENEEAVNGGSGTAVKDIESANDGASPAAADNAADAATGNEAADVALISIHGIVESEFVQYEELDSEELAGQYFDRTAGGTDAASERGAGLKGADKVIYDALREAVGEIAAGKRDTGVVKIPVSAGDAGFKSKYTAADLGLEYVYSGSINPDLLEALEKIAPVHYDEIMDCLIADCACEMFPLSGGAERPAADTLPFYASGSGDDLDVYFYEYVEISLRPADEFADPDAGRYAIDAARIKVARGTAGTAKKIVRSASHIANKTGVVPTTK